jgi:hypothetical protein
MDALTDTRFKPFVDYPARFLLWWGLLLFLCRLGSRRQLDFELRDAETNVLPNVNALAQTQVESLPVDETLAHYLGHVGPGPLEGLRTQMVRRLIRQRVLDKYRLFGRLVVACDGTGHLSFKRRHCPDCLTAEHEHGAYYFHKLCEAKIVTPVGLAVSIATEFHDNRLRGEGQPQAEELGAFARLAGQMRRDFPQTPLCIAGDSLYACGEVLSICERARWGYVLTFDPDHMPAVWREFQALLALCPDRVCRQSLPDKTELEFRWVCDLEYTDDKKRTHRFSAIQCVETGPDGSTRTFAWITNLPVNRDTVIATAQNGGRSRWKIENEGFNVQKNGGYELEHAYGKSALLLRCFYLLLQIAHLIGQLLAKGNLLKRAAAAYGGSVRGVYGSLRNIARRLLDALRFTLIPPGAHSPTDRIQIRLDSG